MEDDRIVVLEDFEGDGEAVAVSLKALIGDKKSPKEKKDEECCGRHKNCKRASDARREPSKGGKK